MEYTSNKASNCLCEESKMAAMSFKYVVLGSMSVGCRLKGTEEVTKNGCKRARERDLCRVQYQSVVTVDRQLATPRFTCL